MNSQPNFYPRLFSLAVAAVLGYALFLIFAPFAAPLAWAAFLAFLLDPLNVRLRARFGGRRVAAAAVLTILAPVVVLLPLTAISIEFAAQITALVRQLQTVAVNLDVRSLADLEKFPRLARALAWLQSEGSISPAQIQDWLISASREVLQRAASLGGSIFLGAVNSLFRTLLMLFLLFFFLCDGDLMMRRARGLIPLDEERKERLFSRLSGITRAVVFGTTLIAVLQGALLGVGFQLASLPSPVVFGVIGFLLAMLPVGGTAMIWVPAAIWLFADGRWGAGIFMTVWGVILSTLDNFLKPLLISGRAPVSTLVVFIGVLGGIGAFGIIGTVLGPVVLSLALALIEFAEEERGPAAVQSAP